MFDLKFSYHVNSPYKKSETGEYGEIGHRLYKVKTTKKIPYIIRVDEFFGGLFFIKFYPSRYVDTKNKYQLRLGRVREFNRLISTCIKIAHNILKQNPDASFGFYGQWDKSDIIQNEDNIKIEDLFSQRFRIYQRVIFSKIDKEKFKFITESMINVMVVVPIHLYENKNHVAKMKSSMDKIFGSSLDKFRVPTQREFDTCKF